MFKKIWSLSDQVILLKRLGELLEKGYSLLQALEFLRFQLPLEKKVQLQHMIDGLKNGKSLHDSFHQLKFHQEMLSYLFYAEQHGDISFALQQGSALLYKKDKYRKDMMKIMQYPMFLAFFLIIMILIFNRILLPQVDMVYSSFGSTAPLFTEQILSTIKLLPYLIFSTIFIVMVGCSVYILYFRKLPAYEASKNYTSYPPRKNISYFKAFALFRYSIERLITRRTIST